VTRELVLAAAHTAAAHQSNIPSWIALIGGALLIALIIRGKKRS
jgi:hypothetical protein